MTLEELTKKFEASFDHVLKSDRAVTPTGEVHIEFLAGPCDSEEDVIEKLDVLMEPYRGKKTLYWRIYPETDQDDNKFDFMYPDKPNPNYKKWKAYARFCATDLMVSS